MEKGNGGGGPEDLETARLEGFIDGFLLAFTEREAEKGNEVKPQDREVISTFFDIAVNKLKVNPESITPEANVGENLGLDSIDLMTLVMGVEENFGIETSDEELEKVRIVEDMIILARLLMSKKDEQKSGDDNPDDDGSAGVREPREPVPNAPSGTAQEDPTTTD